MDIYAPSDQIVDRLKKRLKKPFGLRDVYEDATLQNLETGKVDTPCIAVIQADFIVLDTDRVLGSTLIETRWLIVPTERSYNDRGRGSRAHDKASTLVIETIRHLSAWPPADGFGPLYLKRVPRRKFLAGKVFSPTEWGCTTTIHKAPA